jgi:hypothetical protein
MRIQRVAVVGGGLMGSGIAEASAERASRWWFARPTMRRSRLSAGVSRNRWTVPPFVDSRTRGASNRLGRNSGRGS